MPSSPKPPPAMNVEKTVKGQQDANLLGGQQSQALSTIGQDNPWGSLSYTTTIDPITGLPKYQARQEYTPEQQAIFDQLQSNQTGIGSTAGDAISNMFGQYAQDPNLVGQAGSLTNEALDAQLPAWERFDAPARDQARTQLINQGLVEGSPAYQQQMDKLIQQQDLNRGQWLADFQPKAFQEATTQYQLPLENVAKMLGLSQPGNISQNLFNTPGANVGSADYLGTASAAQDQAFKNYQMKVADQNAWMGMLTGTAGSLFNLPVGGSSGKGAGSTGGNALANMFPSIFGM